jgi:hypothetical protein
MKRSFVQIDDYLPANVDEICGIPVSSALSRISALELAIDEKIHEYCRLNYAIDSSPSIQTKILRNFIRHEYSCNPDNANDPGYFTVYIEGHLLDQHLIHARNDDKLGNSFKYGTFWEKIRLQVDLKGSGQSHGMTYEWTCTDNNHIGMLADCFRFRIPNVWTSKSSAEMQIPVKIAFHRSNDVLPRYELSPVLKSLFPNMRMDPTEADIMTAMW